ncbi:hypothetical protein ACKTEK_10095 [Tepidamorphus sp. 3E244]|uniref:hypothetical protein n=1 Tax=Tepidamorphus sp. 3E244 TaxID=3385498 RepID=UPI0038FCD9F1
MRHFRAHMHRRVLALLSVFAVLLSVTAPLGQPAHAASGMPQMMHHDLMMSAGSGHKAAKASHDCHGKQMGHERAAPEHDSPDQDSPAKTASCDMTVCCPGLQTIAMSFERPALPRAVHLLSTARMPKPLSQARIDQPPR